VSLKHFRNVHIKYKDVKVRVKASLTGKDTRTVKTIDGYKDVARIMSNLFKNGRRLCKTDVVELPPKNVIVTKVSLEDEHYERYKKFVEERMLEFSDGTILDGSTSAGLRQSALQAVLRPDILGLTGKSEVVQAIREIATPVVKEGRKVFILAHYRETVKLIMEEFKAFNPVSMFGETSNKAESLRAFLEDKDCSIMVANYKSGGAGLNLQSVCETVICAEPTSVPGQFNQGTDRAHRVGQVNPVNVYILVAVGTVYVKQVKNMVKKQVAIDSVVVSNDLLAELLGDPGRDSEAEQFVIESSEDIDLPEPHP
jgi:SNF2 family DNA or RNA helicase